MSRGLYFEELEEGMSYTTSGRTITEADIVNFAGVSGDFNPLHLDAEYAAKTQFGKRISHGVLGLSVATGQAYTLGFLEGTIIAFMELNWKFRGPIYIGDTVRTVSTIIKKRPMPAANGGIVSFDVKLVNQNGEAVQKGTWTALIASKDAAQSSASEVAQPEE